MSFELLCQTHWANCTESRLVIAEGASVALTRRAETRVKTGHDVLARLTVRREDLLAPEARRTRLKSVAEVNKSAT